MKPILFNTEMVKAILMGRKTQTRRIIKEVNNSYRFFGWRTDTTGNKKVVGCAGFIKDNAPLILSKPKYKTGDILYIRETWNQLCRVDKDGYTNYNDLFYVYKADKKQPDLYDADGFCLDDSKRKWKPSIHMPKEAARLFLRVTDVRVEKLQDITEEESLKEGIYKIKDGIDKGLYTYLSKLHIGKAWDTAKECFLWGCWNSTVDKNDLDKYGCNANPWVFVYKFEVISKEEAYRNDER